MATEININGTLILDQSSGLQDDDTAIGNNLSGLSADFITFLNTLGLSAAQLAFADDVEAAVSDPNLVTVTQNSATVTDLFFSDADGNALNGDQVLLPGGAALKTVNGDNIYLWSFGDFVIATTSSVAANQGQVVAAFYLDEAADHLSAGIEMVTFIPLAHPDGTNHDDRVDWTDVLNLTASASLSFEFDTLESGKFLWVAVGNNENGLLVTGRDLNVQNAGTAKAGDRVSGGSDPSDAMNTSQGGAGATMGVNNQMFDPGNTAVFTLVKGFTPLDADGPDATGDNVNQIDYDSYINTSGAAMFVSQTQGGGAINVTIGVFNAGGGTTPEEGFGYIGAEGGNDGTSGAFTDDTAVGVDTVQVFNGATLIGTWVDGQASDGTTQNGVKVTINGNLIDVDGIFALYTVHWTADTGQTFNRFHVTGDAGSEKFDIGRIDIDQGVTVTEPVGDQLFVDDDGPDANLATTTATVILDETDNDADDANVGPPLADVTTAISILFNDTSAFGTDGGKDADNNSAVDADAKTYSLTLNAAAGANSGLVDTLSANSIFLYKEGGAIVGRVGNNDGTANNGGAIAFTISVTNDPDNVRVIQNRALVHGDATDPDESDTPRSITADLVLLRLDVLDDDTDTDFATAELGSRIDFEDDGPSITRNATAVPTMTTDDTDITDVAGPTDFSVLFTTAFGSDGFKDANDNDVQDADAITYALGVKAPGVDSGLVDTLSGNKIFLFLESGVVTGRVGNNDGTANNAGTIALSIGVGANTGLVTLTQNRSVVHNDPADPVESGASAAGLAAADLVTLTATATDGDLDTDDVTENIGGAFRFEDDGPSITRNATAVPTMTTDDTDIPDVAGPTDFSVLFTTAFGSDGFKDANDNDVQDADAITYALGVKSPGVDSGLVDTLSGNKIFLFLESGVVTGRVGNNDGTANNAGTVALSISVGANTGLVTLTQNRAVVHNDPADPVESGASAAGLAAADLVTLTATATDGDLDTDDVTENIGGAFRFEDDGPSITRNATAVPTMTTDDTDIPDVAGPTDFSALFTTVFGTDGFKDANDNDVQDADAITYALGVKSPGVDSGLVDTLSGNKIFLFLQSGVINGRVGNNDGTANNAGTVALSISVGANTGLVTLTQNRSVVHNDPADPVESGASAAGLAAADLVTLTATATDGDLDTDDVTENIGGAFRFEDDGPSITRNANAVPTMTTDDSDISDAAGPTDFSVLFSAVFGTDGFKDANDDDVQDADAITYALGVKAPGVDSGLVDTLSGNKIFLFLNGAVINGRVGNNDGTANNAGAVAFSISVAANTGLVTLTQNRAVVHNDPADPVESGASAAGLGAADLVTLTARATDGDLDTDDVTENIGGAFRFEDDGPAITAQILSKVVDFVDGASVGSSLNGDVGSDQNAINDQASDGTKTYTFDSWTTPTNAIAGLESKLSTDGTKIEYFVDANGNDLVDTSELFYDIVLSQSGSGAYTFTVHKDPPQQVIQFDFGDLPSNQSLFGLIAANKAQLGEDDLGLAIVPTSAKLKSDGTYVTGGDGKSNTINTSKGGGPVTIGMSNQLFDKTGEGAFFVYVTDPDDDAVAGVGTGLSTAYDDADNLGFGGTHEIESASYEIVQNSTSSVSRVTAYNIDPGRVGNPATDAGVDTNSRDFCVDPIATDDLVSVTAIRVYDAAGNLLESVANVAGVAVLQDINGDSVVNALDNNSTVGITFFNNGGGIYSANTAISKKDSNYTIEFDTAGPHDMALISWVAGQFDIGGFNFAEGQDTPDQRFDFSVKVTDYDLDKDGDQVADVFDDFSVGVDGTGVFNDGAVA